MSKKEIFEKKNILITGGAGFIGSHLCDRFIKGNRVICLDNFLTSQEENINHLLANPDFEFIRHDLIKPIDLEALPELKDMKINVQGIQEVYHLACPASPRDYNKYPIETLLASAYATYHALEIARKYQTKFMLFSSSTIYGEVLDLENIHINEKYWGYVDPVGDKSCYDEGKRFAESLTRNYQKKYQLDVRIARVWNTYGPRMRLYDGRMIPDLISQAISNEPVKIYGDIDKLTSFCYITDLIEGIARLAKGKIFEPVNLGNSEGAKLREVALKIIELAESGSKLEVAPEKEGVGYVIKQSLPDITLAREALGWFPLVNLNDGLKKTIEYMKGLKAVDIQSLKI
ncbi:MAG: GDP-mannose 4,6-dehydratase [Patescibacteria group bacterium]